MEEKEFKQGDVVYYVRGVNPEVGEVFDRVGVVIMVVDKLDYNHNNTKIWGYKSTTNELIFKGNTFATLEEAKQFARLQMETSPKDSKYYKNRNEEIVILNQKKSIKKPIEQLSLF